jgi:hypothetical protein
MLKDFTATFNISLLAHDVEEALSILQEAKALLQDKTKFTFRLDIDIDDLEEA